MDLGLKGKRAAVTGGTRGIGRAIVDTLAHEHATIAFCARGADGVRSCESDLVARGGTAHGFTVDAGDQAAVARFVDQAAEVLGGLDVLVANVSAMSVSDTAEAWRQSIEIDILGTVALCKAALPHLAKSQGSIVVIGTVATMEVSGPPQPYRSVKAALVPYIKSLAIEWAPKGVRANIVSPGTIYFEGGVWHRIEQGAPQMFQQSLARNPMGRMGTPQEVANAAVFLASPAASFVTGANLVVDGAITRRVQY